MLSRLSSCSERVCLVGLSLLRPESPFNRPGFSPLCLSLPFCFLPPSHWQRRSFCPKNHHEKRENGFRFCWPSLPLQSGPPTTVLVPPNVVYPPVISLQTEKKSPPRLSMSLSGNRSIRTGCCCWSNTVVK